MHANPSVIDLLQKRSSELDAAISAALACADFRSLAALPTGPAKVIPVHLRQLQARVALLQADLGSLIAVARLASLPAEPSATPEAAP